MKKGMLLEIAVLLFFTPFLMAQEIPAGVIAAFNKGNPQELSKYMGEKVELIFQSQSTNTDKPEATIRMTDFFEQNKVDNFNVNHQGKRDESSFIIGTLNTINGKFRVNCFLRKIDNQCLIHQIRIEKTNE